MVHRCDAGSWKIIIPSSSLSMQRGREEFHHQIFSLITDRAVLKESPKFAHVIIGTFSIGASESREPIFIKGGHFSGISQDFTHVQRFVAPWIPL
jgi:hypothetical protein